MPASYPNPRYNGFSSFGQGTPKAVAVALTTTVLLAANSARVYAQINNNTAQPIWIAKGVDAAVGRGTRMNPGSVLTFTANELYMGQLSAITQGSSVNIDVEEGI